MITRLELDGFKSFQQLEVDFAPFQVIVGANGAGKSNLFDSLKLISLLADNDLRSTFQTLRGEAGEVFTSLPNDERIDSIKIAVEMLVGRDIQDSWGAREELKHLRLRYEFTIERRSDNHGLDRLYVVHERLSPIRREEDKWINDHLGNIRDQWLPKLKGGRGSPFISTEIVDGKPTITLHQDGHGGRNLSVAEKVERTVLSSVLNTQFPHAFAAREEMRSWKFLQLNPEALRQPSSMLANQFLSQDGSNLASTLARLESEEPLILKDISRDVANIVPGIIAIEVVRDPVRDQFLIRAKLQDGRSFSSRVLSDGTLRMLALATLKNDDQHHGVLCFEEPENGVHPFRLQNTVPLLRDLATDFTDSEQVGQPLRQLLINTHSPVLVSQLIKSHTWAVAVKPELLFAETATRIYGNGKLPMRVTRILPVVGAAQVELNLKMSQPKTEPETYTVAQIIEYLETADTGEAIGLFKRESAK